MDQRDSGPHPTTEFAGAAALEAPGPISVGPFRIDRHRYEALARDAFAFLVAPTRRNKLHWASWAIALGAEIVLVVILRRGQTYAWERWLTKQFQDVPGRRVIFDVTSTLTNSISLTFVLIFLAILAIVLGLGHRGAALLLLLTFPLHVLAQWPKALIDRPRPSDNFDGIVGVGGFQSFPSGHSEYVVTFYGFLAYLDAPPRTPLDALGGRNRLGHLRPAHRLRPHRPRPPLADRRARLLRHRPRPALRHDLATLRPALRQAPPSPPARSSGDGRLTPR